MNKSVLQKKFRFVMIIAALALFITIFTPAYIKTSSVSKSYPSVVMMWTVLFGTGGGSILNPAFDFSWIAFVGYSMSIILLIICLARKFITVETKDGKKGSIALDAICMICCLISLVMFIILPFLLSSTSTNGQGTYIVTAYAWGVSYILAYIICAIMFISSLIVLYAETIIKIKKIRDKKANKGTEE